VPVEFCRRLKFTAPTPDLLALEQKAERFERTAGKRNL
jgi:hypothetical protein